MSSPEKFTAASTEPYEIGFCKSCGRKLFARLIPMIGEIPLMCECEKERKHKEEEAYNAEKKSRRISDLKFLSGMAPLHKGMLFENFNTVKGTEKAFNEAKLYADRFSEAKKGIMFVGTTGSGKTHLACAIGNALLNEAYEVRFKRAVDLPLHIRGTYSAESEQTEADIILPLQKCQLLIIDDLGADTDTEWKTSIWLSIIDYRINYSLPTIVTTNLNEREMLTRFDKRVSDRLLGAYHKITITAPSYRRKRG